jgi:hypothetical protein
MTPIALVSTAVALGLIVLSGGAYGVLYGAGSLRSSRRLIRASHACYAGQLLLVLAVCLAAPLAIVWKSFLVLSAIAYGFIPPITWRLLHAIHHSNEAQP